MGAEKYLIRVAPEKREEISKALLALGVSPGKEMFGYIPVFLPLGDNPVLGKIREIPGVIEVTVDRKMTILQEVVSQALPLRGPIPINRKLDKFIYYARNPLLIPEALAYSSQEAGERFPTSESRKMVGADVAESYGYQGKGVKVAVLDTGVDYGCPQSPRPKGKSSVDGQPLAYDEVGHGVHCLTTIAGNSIPTPWGQIKGVAPEVEVEVFKVLGYGVGIGSSSSVLRGMMDAFEWGADIISMSLGSPYTEDPPEVVPECRAIEMLTKQGMICVLANGNDGPDPHTVGVPANSPYAISVGAIDRNGNLASFSSHGPTFQKEIKPDVVAPGVYILSSTTGLIDAMQFMDGPKLGAISGTSMACPHLSGLVALMIQLFREKGVKLTSEVFKEMVSLYGETKTNERGWGLPTWDMALRYLQRGGQQ